MATILHFAEKGWAKKLELFLVYQDAEHWWLPHRVFSWAYTDVSGTVQSTMLHHAAMNGHSSIMDVMLHYWDEHNLTVDKYAWLNQPTAMNMTALHLSASRGHAECCGLLLREGADFTIRNEFGRTAADIALQRRRGGVLREFLKWGLLVKTRPGRRYHPSGPSGLQGGHMIEDWDRKWYIQSLGCNTVGRLRTWYDVEWEDKETATEEEASGRGDSEVIIKDEEMNEEEIVVEELNEGNSGDKDVEMGGTEVGGAEVAAAGSKRTWKQMEGVVQPLNRRVARLRLES